MGKNISSRCYPMETPMLGRVCFAGSLTEKPGESSSSFYRVSFVPAGDGFRASQAYDLKAFSILSMKHEQFILLMLIIIIRDTIIYSRHNEETCIGSGCAIIRVASWAMKHGQRYRSICASQRNFTKPISCRVSLKKKKKQYNRIIARLSLASIVGAVAVTVHDGILFIARKSYERFCQVLRK